MTVTGSPAERVDGPALGQSGKDGSRPAWLGLLRAVALGLLLGIGLTAAGFGLFATYIGGMQTPESPQKADAIIVLTGGQARIDAALALLKSGKGARLLISGVHPDTTSRELRQATGSDRKLFFCCVDIDYAAADTVGNAEEGAKWLHRHDYASAILVTNNYHMPRSLLELGRRTEAELRPYPVVNTRLDAGRWLANPDAMRVLFTEYTKYVAALLRGLVGAPLESSGAVARAAAMTG